VRLSVVVPVLNGGEQLHGCLQALGASLRAPDEIIVVDDGSSDGSQATAARHGVRVLATSDGPRGPAHARNLGAAAAAGDVLVFVDADVVVHADALARMESIFAAEPEVAAVFGSYDEDPPARGLASRYKNLQHHYVHQHGNREAATFWAGCGAVRRSAFFAVGGFDDSYRRPSIEDIELGVRLRRAGHRIRLCPEVQATHLKRWSLPGLWRTDICARALPWTRLILRQGQVPRDLNLDWRSRLSALAAWAMIGFALLGLGSWSAGAGLWARSSGVVLLVASALVAMLNADLYRFFLRRGGVSFASGAVLLHFAYLLYSSAVFVGLFAQHKLHSIVRHSRDQTIK
jgi:GT2 family glycosyltransferase